MVNANRKALIIEDEATVRASVAALLENNGWEIVEAESGEKGLAFAQKEHPDLILLDVMLPGIDGFTVYKELRGGSNTERIPVIMLTAINDFELGRRRDAESMAEELGVPPPQGFIEKPFEGGLLLDTIHQIMEH